MKKDIDLAVPTNEDDFRTLRNDRCYFVDKTLLIKELLENRGTKITLITRPRRFGKTLNMTMIREFFDITVDSKDIFEGTEIMKEADCVKLMNKVPVVFFSFKSCDGKNKRQLLVALKKVIFSEYERYGKVFGDSNKIPEDTFIRFIEYKEIMRSSTVNIEQIEDILPDSILLLTQALYEYYKIKPIVIIDEYDYPFIEAKVNGFYDEINTILSTMFCEAFKGNQYLDKGIMTGIQKIAQESIFSKFNNPSICMVVDEAYHDKFGLTEAETKAYLEYFGFELTDEVKEYYDGYRFNGVDIYNPMSITTYISKKGFLDKYWVDTSTNSLIREAIMDADEDFYEDFDSLVENDSCITAVNLNTSFVESVSETTLWGLLLNAGYVTSEKRFDAKLHELKIPNEEVKSEFQSIVAKYIGVKDSVLDKMFRALLNKDIKTFIRLYQKIVMGSTSYFDAVDRENSYHMLMLGMCIYLEPRFKVESNKERGLGRFDVLIKAKRKGDLNVVIEFKYVNSKRVKQIEKSAKDKDDIEKKELIREELEKEASEALGQIKEKQYDFELKGDVLMLGVAHRVKQVVIKHKLKKI